MSAETLLRQAADDGVELIVTPTGKVKARGAPDMVRRWLPVLREHKLEIVATLAANEDARFRWIIRLVDREPVEVIFSDAVTAADVRELYPGAAAVEAAPAPPGRRATKAEVAEIANLISTVYRSDTDVDRAEALAAALADPASALICYRLLARATASHTAAPPSGARSAHHQRNES